MTLAALADVPKLMRHLPRISGICRRGSMSLQSCTKQPQAPMWFTSPSPARGAHARERRMPAALKTCCLRELADSNRRELHNCAKIL
jgi:hypothetical protein